MAIRFIVLLLLFFISIFALCLFSQNLLLRLLLLEITSFVILGQVSLLTSSLQIRDIVVISLFSVFVIEGVIALSGLISLVSFTGSDIVGSSSLLKL